MHAAFDREAFVDGLRRGRPFALVALLLSTSFGALAVESGFTGVQAVVMSAVVHAGSAQFAAASIVAAGGGVLPGVLAASLMNSRFLAMGVAAAGSFPGRPGSRFAQAQTVVDPSWVVANRGDGTFDRWLLMGMTVPQYAGWVSGTLLGVVLGDVVGDLDRFGLDAVFPTFFLGLLITELGDPRARWIAGVGALIALALVPVAPVGVPVLAASAAAVIGLGRRRVR